MIVCPHEPNGEITQVLMEPISPDYLDALTRRAIPFVVEDCDLDGRDVFARWYVENGALARRPAFPASIDRTEITADGKDKAVITGLPRPCIVLIDGEPIKRKGGTLTLTSDMPADYEIAVRLWPYLDWTVTVRAR